MSESKKAIDTFTIHQFEQMARAAYVDEQQIEKLREVGIPRREPWAVNLCEQLASGFMFIAAQWRKPTDQDVFAANQRIAAIAQSLEREKAFAGRLELRKQVADLTRASATDAERAAVEALLKSGRANPVAIASEPERLSVEAAKFSDTSKRDAAIDSEADLATFYPSLREGDKGISFVASERTRVIYEAHEGGSRSIIMESGDSFKMDEAGNFTITPVSGEQASGHAKPFGPDEAISAAAVIDSSYQPKGEFDVIEDAAEAAQKIEAGGQVGGAMSLAGDVVELTFVAGGRLRMTAAAFHAARAMIEGKAGFLPLTPDGIDGAIRQNGRVTEAKPLGANMMILQFENGQKITVPADAWERWGSTETAPAAAEGVQASGQPSEAAGSDSGANAEAGGGIPAAVQATDSPVRMDGGGRSA